MCTPATSAALYRLEPAGKRTVSAGSHVVQAGLVATLVPCTCAEAGLKLAMQAYSGVPEPQKETGAAHQASP